MYKPPGSDQIVAELIQARSNTLCCESHKHTNSIGIRKNCLSNRMSLLLYQFTGRVIALIVVNIDAYHCSSLSPYVDKIIGDH
jgi:hypothetical protein